MIFGLSFGAVALLVIFWGIVIFPRVMGVIVLIVMVLIGWVGYLFVTAPTRIADRAAAQAAVLQAQPVIIIADANGMFCKDPDLPVHVLIQNRASNARIMSVTFQLSSTRPNYSNVVSDDFRWTDRILAPGERFSICYQAPAVPLPAGVTLASLDWHVELKSIRWE